MPRPAHSYPNSVICGWISYQLASQLCQFGDFLIGGKIKEYSYTACLLWQEDLFFYIQQVVIHCETGCLDFHSQYIDCAIASYSQLAICMFSYQLANLSNMPSKTIFLKLGILISFSISQLAMLLDLILSLENLLRHRHAKKCPEIRTNPEKMTKLTLAMYIVYSYSQL